MTATILLTAIVLAGSAPAAASPEPSWRGVVVLLVPSVDDDVTRNARARISGELAAAPFKTFTVPIDPDRDVLSQVEAARGEQGALATVAIVRDGDALARRVTIWVSSLMTDTTTIRRLPIEDGQVDRAAARIAVETVEMVRASLPGFWPLPATPPPLAAEVRPPPPKGARVSVALGAGRMTDFGDAPAFWAPRVEASYGRRDGIELRVTASGFGPGVDLSSDLGSAHVTRDTLTMGVARSFRADRIVQPRVGVGVGVQHLEVHGTYPPPLANERRAFSALAMVSLGIGFALGSRVTVIAEADAMMSRPETIVRIGESDVATFDRPFLFTHVGLRASF